MGSDILLFDISNLAAPTLIETFTRPNEDAYSLTLTKDENWLFVMENFGMRVIPLTANVVVQTDFYDESL